MHSEGHIPGSPLWRFCAGLHVVPQRHLIWNASNGAPGVQITHLRLRRAKCLLKHLDENTSIPLASEQYPAIRHWDETQECALFGKYI